MMIMMCFKESASLLVVTHDGRTPPMTTVDARQPAYCRV
jgi:hypothetical protein